MSGLFWAPERENDSRQQATHELVTHIYEIESGGSFFKQYCGHISSDDETQPQPEGGLQAAGCTGGFGVLYKVGQDVNEDQRSHERENEFFCVAVTLHFPKHCRGPVNDLKKLVAKEERRIPESSEKKVHKGGNDHCGVFDFHVVFSLVGN